MCFRYQKQRKRSASQSLKLRGPISSACERQTFLLAHRRWAGTHGPSGVERGETAVFAGYNFIWPKFCMSLQIPTYATPESKHAFLFSNDNRNLCKYIIDFIIKITNGFSNRVTSEHSTTLLKFIYIVWATPKRFFVTTTWNNLENARPQKYSFRNVTALAEILSERIATVFF